MDGGPREVTDLLQLRRFARVVNGGTPTNDERNWNGQVPWATPIDLARRDGGVIGETDRYLTSEGLRSGSASVPAGSVLISTRAPIGYVALTERACAFNQGCKGLVPLPEVDARFLRYWLSAQRDDLQASGSGSTFLELSASALAAYPVPRATEREQRRISDFLDHQVTRIDNIIAARKHQIELLGGARTDAAWRTVAGTDVAGPRRATGLAWLPQVPAMWPLATVHAGYDVVLGKMLDERKQTGLHPLPYLRNTNVQWDNVSIDDVKIMDVAPDEYARFTVRAGDLLICEGGQPGRSAVWNGSVEPIGFQKALHRARGRGGNDVRWLQAFLRIAVALDVFGIEFGQATIGHLTGEQLRSLRLPMPPIGEQGVRADLLESEIGRLREAEASMTRSIGRYEELKRSLITAAVTGEFDVSTADGLRVPI